MTIHIREEQPEDTSSVRRINELAFGGPAEAQLVDRLRASGKAIVSLVATVDTGGERVVGHILFSPITVARSFEGFRGLGLAPMAVLPEFQNRGIGSQLVRAGLEACRRKGIDAIVVLGHTHFYPRFGFSRAMDHGLENEYGASDSFMVMELRTGVLGQIGGLVKYAREFQDL